MLPAALGLLDQTRAGPRRVPAGGQQCQVTPASSLSFLPVAALLGILYEDKERQDFIFTIYHWWQAVAIFIVYLGASLPMKVRLGGARDSVPHPHFPGPGPRPRTPLTGWPPTQHPTYCVSCQPQFTISEETHSLLFSTGVPQLPS